jgi:hypothetical protein
MSDAIRLVTASISAAKSLADTTRHFECLKTKQLLLELEASLVELKDHIMEMKTENLRMGEALANDSEEPEIKG